MELAQVAAGRVAGDERPAAIARMVDAVERLVGEVVDAGRGDVACSERHGGEAERQRERVESGRMRRSEQQEEPDHRRDAVAKHPSEEHRQQDHFEVTTLSGQIDVSTRM